MFLWAIPLPGLNKLVIIGADSQKEACRNPLKISHFGGDCDDIH